MTIHTTINSPLPPATAFKTVLAKHSASATVGRDAFAKAVTACNRVVSKRHNIPILQNVRLHGTASGLVVTGTNLDVAISCPVTGESDAGFAVTVPGHMLANLLKSAKTSDVVKIEVHGETLVTEKANLEQPGTACLDFAGFKATLPTLPVADFPTLETATGEFTNYFTLPTADLLRAFTKTHFAVSTEETRYYLNGVYMHAVGKDLRFAATDGHRLAVVTLPAPAFLDIGGLPLQTVAGHIIPRQSVAELIRLCKAKGAAKEARFAMNNHYARVTIGDVELLTKHINGTFPDYGRVVPSGNDKRLTVDRQGMIAAIKQVTCLSEKDRPAVRLAMADSHLCLSVANLDGVTTAHIEIDWAHEPMEIGFNAKYLTSTLDMVDGFRADIILSDPATPVIIRSNDSADHYYVLMPMRC